MDDAVLQAMQRWPDVPAVHGWLSLDARGRWKLHPNGGANAHPPEPGDPVTNSGLIAFINRNYAHDDQGQWFFQNGPQRVYVTLEAAPYVIRLADDGVSLQTHTGHKLDRVDEWLLDDEGHLYVRMPQGLGRIEDRDLPPVLAGLHTPDGPLLDALENGVMAGDVAYPALPTVCWRRIDTPALRIALGQVGGAA